MRSFCRSISILVVASLAACSGGANSSLPATSTAATSVNGAGTAPQTVSRRVVDSSGAVRSILYTVQVERSGRVTAGPANARRTLATSSNNLLYNGGPIQPAPKMYVVFWGSTWSSSTGDPRGVRTYLTNFLTRVGGSSWLSTVTQYTQSDGANVGNAAGSLGGTWIDTSSIPSLTGSSYQNYLAAEAKKAATHFGDTTVNASYVIALPHGVKVNGFAYTSNWTCYFFGCYCAWHSTGSASNGATIAYTNLPYQPDAGGNCGQGIVNSPGYNDGVSIVEGHEQAETETDPQLNAWYDSSGNEIGDKCAWTNLQDTQFGGTTVGTNDFPTQPLWSNAANGGAGGCVQ